MGVLHSVAQSPCGLAELCERTGLPRATAYRLAAALEVHRLLARDDEGRWRLGPAVTELAAHVNDPLLAASSAVLPCCARPPAKACSCTGVRAPTGSVWPPWNPLRAFAIRFRSGRDCP